MKDIKKMTTNDIVTYQNIIGGANHQLNIYLEQMEQLANSGEAPRAFCKEQKEKIESMINKNSDIYYEMEKEITDRMKKSFPTATTPGIMTKLYTQLDQSIMEYKKMHTAEKPEVIKMETTKPKEKRV